MPIEKYKVEYPDLYWECTIEIDKDFKLPDNNTVDLLIKNMVEFWSEWEQNLEYNEGDYTKTFVKQLAQRCLLIVLANDYNTVGVVEEFNDMEGYVPMDGSMGIKVVYTDDVNIRQDDFVVSIINSEPTDERSVATDAK